MQSEKTKLFISKAQAVHGDRYDYSKVKFSCIVSNVVIICKTHKDFSQPPYTHLRGNGCPACTDSQKKLSEIKFIAKAQLRHGDKYDYSKVKYTHSHKKVTITCMVHGDFEQMANNHLSGHGCPVCGVRTLGLDEFIRKARQRHGDLYSYSKSDYVHSQLCVIITCISHGDFKQTPNSHLQGSGCTQCAKGYHKPASIYLLTNGEQVKIGISVNINRRLAQLTAKSPFAIELLASWEVENFPLARSIEGKAHRQLKKQNAKLEGFAGATEWFNVRPDIAAELIKKLVDKSKQVEMLF